MLAEKILKSSTFVSVEDSDKIGVVLLCSYDLIPALTSGSLPFRRGQEQTVMGGRG